MGVQGNIEGHPADEKFGGFVLKKRLSEPYRGRSVYGIDTFSR